MPIQEELTIEAFLGVINEILQQGFPTGAIHAYLQNTLIKPRLSAALYFFRPQRYTRNLVFKNGALNYW